MPLVALPKPRLYINPSLEWFLVWLVHLCHEFPKCIKAYLSSGENKGGLKDLVSIDLNFFLYQLPSRVFVPAVLVIFISLASLPMNALVMFRAVFIFACKNACILGETLADKGYKGVRAIFHDKLNSVMTFFECWPSMLTFALDYEFSTQKCTYKVKSLMRKLDEFRRGCKNERRRWGNENSQSSLYLERLAAAITNLQGLVIRRKWFPQIARLYNGTRYLNNCFAPVCDTTLQISSLRDCVKLMCENNTGRRRVIDIERILHLQIFTLLGFLGISRDTEFCKRAVAEDIEHFNARVIACQTERVELEMEMRSIENTNSSLDRFFVIQGLLNTLISMVILSGCLFPGIGSDAVFPDEKLALVFLIPVRAMIRCYEYILKDLDKQTIIFRLETSLAMLDSRKAKAELNKKLIGALQKLDGKNSGDDAICRLKAEIKECMCSSSSKVSADLFGRVESLLRPRSSPKTVHQMSFKCVHAL